MQYDIALRSHEACIQELYEMYYKALWIVRTRRKETIALSRELNKSNTALLRCNINDLISKTRKLAILFLYNLEQHEYKSTNAVCKILVLFVNIPKPQDMRFWLLL